MLWQYLAACGRKENPRGVTYVIKEVDGSFKGRIAVQICSGSCVKVRGALLCTDKQQ